jgi:hypothetical protein
MRQVLSLNLPDHPGSSVDEERPVIGCGALELQLLAGTEYRRFDWWAPPCRAHLVGPSAVTAYDLLRHIADSLAGPES